MLAHLFPGMVGAIVNARARADLSVAATDQDNADMAEKTPGSLVGATFTQIIMEKRNLRFVAIDGAEPSLENYQPLVNLRTEEVSGFEALIRWNHPERGLVAPLEFIPLAEETALIVPIGEWVLRQACSEAMNWPAHISIAVNLSPAQFKMPNLSQMVISALAQSGLPAPRLELEITESVLLVGSESTLETLYKLRNLGVRISMDDFGTGYSSLSYLRSFPFDKIKIDQSFVHDLAANTDSQAIVRAVTALGSGLGMMTTGEGVETQEEGIVKIRLTTLNQDDEPVQIFTPTLFVDRRSRGADS